MIALRVCVLRSETRLVRLLARSAGPGGRQTGRHCRPIRTFAPLSCKDLAAGHGLQAKAQNLLPVTQSEGPPETGLVKLETVKTSFHSVSSPGAKAFHSPSGMG